MFPRLFTAGGVTLYSYGIMLALGAVLGYFLAVRGAPYRSLTRSFVSNAVSGAVISGIIFARLGYILISPAGFLSRPSRVFMIGEGGLVFWGGLAGAALWLWYYCRREKAELRAALDILSPAAALGYAFGRIGCFLAGCCWGIPTEFFAGVVFSHPETLCAHPGPVHPVQLYSAVFTLILALFLYRRLKNSPAREGKIFGLYLVLYSVFRFFIEFLRGDFRGREFLSLTPTQWVALLGIITGAVIFYRRGGRARKGS